MGYMEHVTEILHDLIDAAKVLLPANRVGELHDLADKAADLARGAEEAVEAVEAAVPEPEPAEPASGTPAAQ